MVAVRSACLLESQRSAAHGREADALGEKSTYGTSPIERQLRCSPESRLGLIASPLRHHLYTPFWLATTS